MSEKKNIEKLFQEKFSNFETLPPSDSWKNIESKLKTAKGSPAFFTIFMKFSGIAALITLSLFLWNKNSELPSRIENNIVVSNENRSNLPTQKVNSTQNVNNTKVSENSIIKESLAENSNTESNSNEKTPKNSIIKESLADKTSIISIKKESLAENSNIESNSKEKSSKNSKENYSKESFILNPATNTSIQLATQNTIDLVLNTVKLFPLNSTKNNSELLVNATPKESLPKINNKKSPSKEIVLRPNAAPIFLNATAGSPIDSRFADNTKTFNNTMSYGLGIDVGLSKKWNIRTGVNKINLSYSTNNISFYNNLTINNPANITRGGSETINLSQTASLLTITDQNSIDPEIGQNQRTGSLNQLTGYFEVPVELSYKILDKKFAVQIISGFSTLILNENKLNLETNNGININVGEANNLNPIHFTTNLGLGLKYKIFKNFEANIEPTLKYQFFTYNTNAGGFKPYFFGIYSGVNYKF